MEGMPRLRVQSCNRARSKKEERMEDHVYRIIEISGSSQKSIEDAIQNAVGRAGRTLRNLRWFEVLQTRGHLEGDKIQHYQVVLKIGFTIDDSNAGA
jgi:flavin-binding protein dodecin